MKIKILKEDSDFSRLIRKRDGKCVRCNSKVAFNDDGHPITHQASHFWSRGHWATRFDPENVDTLCFGCHQLWGGDLRDEYKDFKMKQLGEERYIKLQQKANIYANKLKEREKAREYFKLEYPKL